MPLKATGISIKQYAAFRAGVFVLIFFPTTSSISAERHLFGWDAEPLSGTIGADRPGFSTSPQTVPAGRLQIEGGYQFTADRGVDSHTLPLVLIRAGLTKKIELRIGWDGLSWTENNGRFKPEASDMSVALKAHVVEHSRLLPAIGLLGSLSLPTGSGSSTSNRVDPTGGLLWNYDFAAGPSLFGTVLMSSVTGDDGRFFEAANAIGISLPINDRFDSFVEYFGFYRKDGGGATHNFNGGFTFLLTDNLQLDINGGFGLNGRADDYFLGAGFAFRF
jgi:hypothetical protein